VITEVALAMAFFAAILHRALLTFAGSILNIDALCLTKLGQSASCLISPDVAALVSH
jgi:hypothetical protein